MVLAPFLAVGLLTPLTASICLLIQILRVPSAILPGSIAVLITCALATMGAGAYSFDAILYGRRKIVLHSSPDEKSR
jgi:hypothetical protein